MKRICESERLEIRALAAKGKNNSQIARKFDISEASVRNILKEPSQQENRDCDDSAIFSKIATPDSAELFNRRDLQIAAEAQYKAACRIQKAKSAAELRAAVQAAKVAQDLWRKAAGIDQEEDPSQYTHDQILFRLRTAIALLESGRVSSGSGSASGSGAEGTPEGSALEGPAAGSEGSSEPFTV